MPEIQKEPVGICQAIEQGFWNSRNKSAQVAFYVNGALQIQSSAPKKIRKIVFIWNTKCCKDVEKSWRARLNLNRQPACENSEVSVYLWRKI